jgi:predicted nucleic acid-binding protein
VTNAFDSNILVYTIEPGNSSRKARARELLIRSMRGGTDLFLLQTLAEFANVAVRKLGVPGPAVLTQVDAWRASLPVRAAAEEDLPAALAALRDHGLGFWDAYLWATARRVGVDTLLTEDFQDGGALGGVRFINPFNSANAAMIDRVLPP